MSEIDSLRFKYELGVGPEYHPRIECVIQYGFYFIDDSNESRFISWEQYDEIIK